MRDRNISIIKKKLIALIVILIIIISIFIPLGLQFHWYPFNKTYFPIDGKLDTSFIYNMTENLSNIVYNAYNESSSEIAQGRFYGTKGEHKAADYIQENLTIFGFESNKIYREYIENINYPFKCIDLFLPLTAKLEVTSQQLIIVNKENGTRTKISDFYISPRWNNSFLNPLYDKNKLNYTFNENNLDIINNIENTSFKGPFNTSWFDKFLLNERNRKKILENYSMFDKLDNFAIWLISLFEENYDINYSIYIQNNNSYVLVEEDRAFNPNAKNIIPAWEPYYYINNSTNPVVKLIHTYIELIQMIHWSQNNPRCKGIIRYDFNNETYDMNLHRYNVIPIIYITGEIGKKIIKNLSNYKINYVLEQRYNNSINSSNIIGQIDGIDNSKTVIISCLYDSWWNQGTADSAIGMSIVLAIAKYMKVLEKRNIKPYYKTKFIAFSGEEYGRVGARYYDEKHRDEYIYAIIDVNQVGFNNSELYKNRNLTLQIWTNQPFRPSFKNYVWNIVNRTNYYNRTKVVNMTKSDLLGGYVGNQYPFALNRPLKTKTVYFVKDFNWTFHHRDGMNHSEGDAMNYYYNHDVEVIGEMILNVTIGLNPLVLTEIYVYIPLIITLTIIAIILILIWKKMK